VAAKKKDRMEVLQRGLEEANRQYFLKVVELSVIRRIVDSLTRDLGVADICRHIVDIVADEITTDVCSLFLREREGGGFMVATAASRDDLTEAFLAEWERESTRLAHQAVEEEHAVVVADVQAESEQREGGGPPLIRSFLCVPLLVRGRVLGAVELGHAEPDVFNERHRQLLTIIANQTAVGLLNVELYHDLRERTENLAQAHRELQEAQMQLVQSEKMASLGQLVAGVAHEINTPLGAIQSNMEMLAHCRLQLEAALGAAPGEGAAAEGIAGARRVAKALEEINRVSALACRRMGDIVKSLRNFARLDESEYKSADLHEGLESTLTLLQYELKDRVEVVRDFGELPCVYCYPHLLNQVFMNLMMNSIQAIEGPGRITVTTRCEDGEVVISIADTGKGVAEEHLAHIFDPGFTTKSRGVGTGLGLAISYRIISDHHGTLRVAHTSPRGTEMVIRLPIAAAQRPGSEPTTAVPEEGAGDTNPAHGAKTAG